MKPTGITLIAFERQNIQTNIFATQKIVGLSLVNPSVVFKNPLEAIPVITAKIKKISIVDKTWIIKLKLENKKLNKYLIEKASISINGVSLTISKVMKGFFEINVIPHTLKLTNLKNLKIKDIVNVELDIFGKYIMKLSN